MALTPLNSDVVVIGAGTSGLSAAKSLKDIGYSVIVIEAANHIGGRCVTDNSIFDIPFDIGGSWLHSAVTNPLAEIAVQNNFGYKCLTTDLEAFFDFVKKLLNKDLRERMGNNSYKYLINEFNTDISYNKIIKKVNL